MAKRGTSKDLSIRHEDHIAATYGGKRSASSGAADNDAGDVRCEDTLFECKVTGGPTRPSRLPVFVRHMEKIAEEARYVTTNQTAFSQTGKDGSTW